MTGRIKMLVLSLTGACNYACAYCYAASHAPVEMSFTTARQALDLAGAGGSTEFILQLSGGEPLLAFGLMQKIVAYVEAKKLPARIQLQTNGSLITDEIAVYLQQHNIAIGVSLDGRPDVNDQLRKFKNGSGATRAILAGLAVLRRHNLAAGITCVVTDRNVRQLSGVVEMAYYAGNVRRLGFDLLRCQGRGSKLTPPGAADVHDGVDAAFRTGRELQKLTGIPLKFSQMERVNVLKTGAGAYCFGHCYAMNGNAAFVDPLGDIYCCSSLIGNKDFYLGNTSTGLDEKKVQQVADRIKKSMEFCTCCPDFKLCGGGCFARWYGSGKKTAYPGECALKRVAIALFQMPLQDADHLLVKMLC